MKTMDIRPFIPALEFEVSKLFYEALGFQNDPVTGEMTIMSKGGCTFFLYKYTGEALENTNMIQLVVPNINDELELIEKIRDIDFKYEPIKEERWGRVIYLWGPFGEHWQVTELIS